MTLNTDTRFNFEGVKNTSQGQDVRSDEALRKFLVEVGINEGQAKNVDQFYTNDIPTAKLTRQEIGWGQGYFACMLSYLNASTTNPKSGRRYNLGPLIILCYERIHSMAVYSKAEEGFAFLNLLKRESVQHLHEQSNARLTQEERKGSWFNREKVNTEQKPGYGNFERS